MVEVVARHPWLGVVRWFGSGELLARIEIDPSVRSARANGRTDAEVLIAADPGVSGDALTALLDLAARRVQGVLAALEQVKADALACVPAAWREHFEAAGPVALVQLLFVEGFWLDRGGAMRVAFDFGDLDLLVVQLDEHGRGIEARVVG